MNLDHTTDQFDKPKDYYADESNYVDLYPLQDDHYIAYNAPLPVQRCFYQHPQQSTLTSIYSNIATPFKAMQSSGVDMYLMDNFRHQRPLVMTPPIQPQQRPSSALPISNHQFCYRKNEVPFNSKIYATSAVASPKHSHNSEIKTELVQKDYKSVCRSSSMDAIMQSQQTLKEKNYKKTFI